MSADGHERGPDRRDVVTIAALTFGGVGAALSLWPFFDQANPHQGTEPRAGVEVDLTPIAAGQTITVQWQGKPVFIRHRTVEEIAAMRAVGVERLHDSLARNPAHPTTALALDANRTVEDHAQWLLVVGICTHLGCVLTPNPPAHIRAEGAAFFCACHAARFDTSGRVVGGPAATNLPIPPYQFLSATRLRLG